MVSGSTLKCIEQGIYRLWPNEWITQTIDELKAELDNKIESSERSKRVCECLVQLSSERVKRG